MTRKEMPYQHHSLHQTYGSKARPESMAISADPRTAAGAARRSWIARLETSNKKWGGKFAVLSSGVRG